LPISEVASEGPPEVITAAPAVASTTAAQVREVGRSRPEIQDSSATKIGAVLTSRTLFATDVNSSEVIQLPKCSASNPPAAAASAMARPDVAGLIPPEARAAGRTTAEASVIRQSAMASAGAAASLTKIEPKETPTRAAASTA